jgi:hypothetical protein
MHLRVFFPKVLYTVWCLSKLYTDTIFVKTTCKCFQRKEKRKKKLKQKKKAQIWTVIRARVFNAGLLARSKSSVVFLLPRANADLVPKFNVALHAYHAALPMVTPNISL